MGHGVCGLRWMGLFHYMWEVSISVISVLICLAVYGCTERNCNNLLIQLQSSLTLPQHTRSIRTTRVVLGICTYIHTYSVTCLHELSGRSTSLHGGVTAAVLTVH